jgi:hypothetical protein
MSTTEHLFDRTVQTGVVRCLRCGILVYGAFLDLYRGEPFWVRYFGNGTQEIYPGPLGLYPVNITVTPCRRVTPPSA